MTYAPPAREEFQQRIAKVQQEMRAREYDALITYSNDDSMAGGNGKYLSGYSSSIGAYYVLVIPAQGDVSMLIQPGINRTDINYAKKTCWIEDIRTVSIRNTQNDRGYNIDSTKVPDFAGASYEVLSERNLLKGRIGLAGIPQMNWALFESFREMFRSVELVDGKGIVEKVRKAKSPYEISLIREGCRLSDMGLNLFLQLAEPGMTHSSLMNEAGYQMMKEGAHVVKPLFGAGRDPFYWGANHHGLVFLENDIIAAEYNIVFGGYYAQQARTRFFERPSSKVADIYKILQEVENAMAMCMKPGVTGGEIYEVGEKKLSKYGLAYMQGGRPGHGMGLTLSEGLSVLKGDTNALVNNEYIVLHPSVAHPDHPGKIMYGNAYIVTDHGIERMTNASDWI